MYRLLQESLLGVRREADTLRIEPLVPPTWQQFRIHYRFHGTMYHIEVIIEGPNTRNVRRVVVDGNDTPALVIHMVDDHTEHAVRVFVG
jgi:cellobiose phosphorylase